jgi:hypothetical protein
MSAIKILNAVSFTVTSNVLEAKQKYYPIAIIWGTFELMLGTVSAVDSL